MNLLFIDVETTGLVPAKGLILEVAFCIKPPDLSVDLARGSWVVKHQIEDVLPLCDDYVMQMHTDNGLLAEIAQEKDLRELSWIEDEIIRECREHGCIDANIGGKRYRTPLCGSTPSFDRKWLDVYMPKLAGNLSHRHIDVSTLLELVARWFGPMPESFSIHRAGPDVHRSISALIQIRSRYFSPYNRQIQGPAGT